MFNITKKSITWGHETLSIETGLIARQADGCVLVTYGETQVMATVVAAKTSNPEQDFFPLTVNYQEKFYATGRIPGGFFKREARPTEKETLVSRLIDRPIRPLFPSNFLNETQIICTVLSHDGINDPDIVALVAASAALTVSGIPFFGPIGGARVGYVNDSFVLNPTADDMASSTLDLVVAGTTEGVLMVESEAQQLSEEVMLNAVSFGHDAIQEVINLIIDVAEDSAKEPWQLPEQHPLAEGIYTKIMASGGDDFAKAYHIQQKQERYEALSTIRTRIMDEMMQEYANECAAPGFTKLLGKSMKKVESTIVRQDILVNKTRIDGRKLHDIRPIDCRVELLSKVHGSALFTRGETQALVVSTLGSGQDEQMIDAIEGEYKQNFMLHYNFPPFSVGETGRTGSPGRREIGHGKLAWRALNPLLPAKEDFPYTIRIVSEITESNGSSSMASVCGGSLSLMDAGVPLKAPCAGIAMGLIKEGDDFAVLSDILGDEDHLGDMDFKVAGTSDGITALQMDIKITSITKEIMEIALKQAHAGRLHILSIMNGTIVQGREDVSNNAPRMVAINVPKDKIRDIIGTGGKTIREITETTGAKIDIDDEGQVTVFAVSAEGLAAAIERIEGIIAVAEVGKIYQGVVSNIVDFGAFVTFLPAKDGLVHVSEMLDERVNHPSDVVSEGQHIWVKCIGIDDRGKVKLSMRYCDQETGEERTPAERERKPRDGDDDGQKPPYKKRRK